MGIFLNLIDLSVSCCFIVENREIFVEVPTFLVEQFLFVCCWVFFLFVLSIFVLASYMLACICHTLTLSIHVCKPRANLKEKSTNLELFI